MNKNRFMFLSMLMITLMGTMVVSACGDDEEEVGNKEDTTNKIVGVWKCVFGNNDYILMNLNADATGHMFEYDDGKIDEDENFTYKYDTETNILTVYWEEYQDKAVVQWIDNNSFRWNFDGENEDMIWIRQNGEDEDPDYPNNPDDPDYLTCPDNNHPHAIDLGLPSGTKWCCCNVGASTPEGYGGYYAWGETNEKKYYSLDTYAYYDKNTKQSINIGYDIAGTSYDVAHVMMGGSWRMPSYTQQMELLNNCSREWTSQNSVMGILVTGPNSEQIFLPAAGWLLQAELRYDGTQVNYWSSSFVTDSRFGGYGAYGISFSSYYCNLDYYSRNAGLSVRAVCP